MYLVNSVRDEWVYAERALKAGARGFIMKSAPAGELVKALRVVLAGHIYLSNSIAPNAAKALQQLAGNNNANGGVESLSARELEIFELIGKGAAKLP